MIIDYLSIIVFVRVILRKLSFCHNFKFSIPISLKLKGVNLWFFKLRLSNLTEIIVWNIKGLHHQVEKIKGLENMSLWQRLNFLK